MGVSSGEPIKAEWVDGEMARAALRQLNLRPLDGSNNDVVEHWVTDSGQPHMLPYFKRGDKDRFLKRAFEDLVDELT